MLINSSVCSACLFSWYGLLIIDVTKHHTGRTGPKYRSWVLVKCVWCGAYYWFQLRKGTGYGFHAFLTCILLLLLLIQCKISLYLGPVRTVRCFVTPANNGRWWLQSDPVFCIIISYCRWIHATCSVSKIMLLQQTAVTAVLRLLWRCEQ